MKGMDCTHLLGNLIGSVSSGLFPSQDDVWHQKEPYMSTGERGTVID